LSNPNCYAVFDPATGQIVSTHTSIWPAKRAIQLNSAYELRIMEDGEWVKPEDARIYRR
jgi:hypothetical protein